MANVRKGCVLTDLERNPGAPSPPDGDTLITDSESGRAFEVTREGAKVWEFWKPESVDAKRAHLPARAAHAGTRRALPEALMRIEATGGLSG